MPTAVVEERRSPQSGGVEPFGPGGREGSPKSGAAEALVHHTRGGGAQAYLNWGLHRLSLSGHIALYSGGECEV